MSDAPTKRSSDKSRPSKVDKARRLLLFNTTADRCNKSNSESDPMHRSRAQRVSRADFAGGISRILAVEKRARRSTNSASGAKKPVTSRPSARVRRSCQPSRRTDDRSSLCHWRRPTLNQQNRRDAAVKYVKYATTQRMTTTINQMNTFLRSMRIQCQNATNQP